MIITNRTIKANGDVLDQEIEVPDNFFEPSPTSPTLEQRIQTLEEENTLLIDTIATITGTVLS